MIWIFALKPSMLWLEQTLVYIWLLMLGYIYSINKQKSDVIRSIHSSRDKIGTVCQDSKYPQLLFWVQIQQKMKEQILFLISGPWILDCV